MAITGTMADGADITADGAAITVAEAEGVIKRMPLYTTPACASPDLKPA